MNLERNLLGILFSLIVLILSACAPALDATQVLVGSTINNLYCDGLEVEVLTDGVRLIPEDSIRRVVFSFEGASHCDPCDEENVFTSELGFNKIQEIKVSVPSSDATYSVFGTYFQAGDNELPRVCTSS